MSPRAQVLAAGQIARARADLSQTKGRTLSFQSLILDLQKFWADQGEELEKRFAVWAAQ